jgi:flagellar L-ring protein FlgH
MSDSSNRKYVVVLGIAMLTAGAIAQAQESHSPLYRSLYADRKAHRAGDILTVLITESASASATARTRADKQDSVFGSIGWPNDELKLHELELGSDFSGGGQIQRTGRLLGKIAVIVEDVDANGNLRIRGEQDIHVNNEKQSITLGGIVRSEDIAPDNTVMSWRISEAKIDFKGNGILARKQSPGLLSKLFDLFGLN